MYFVYVLLSKKDDELYVGYTTDLKRRLGQHWSGEVTSTSYRRPLKLVYYQAFLSRKDAMREERYLKSGGRAHQQLKIRIQESLDPT